MRKFLGFCLTIGALAVVAPAHADCRGKRESADIQKTYQGDSVIRVREELELIGPNCYGQELERIYMVASSDRLGSMAWLEINGKRMGEFIKIGTETEKHVFELRSYRDELGVEIKSIQIRLNGTTRVEKIGVAFDGDSRDRQPDDDKSDDDRLPPPRRGDDDDKRDDPIDDPIDDGKRDDRRDDRRDDPRDDRRDDRTGDRMRDREFMHETFLGETGFIGAQSGNNTVQAERVKGNFVALILRAEDDDFAIERMDVYFVDGAVQSWGKALVQEGQPLRVDLVARSQIDFIVVRGRSSSRRGGDANLTFWGLE